MARAIVLQHVPFEGPGRIAEAFERVGYEMLIRRLCDGDAVPTEIANQEVLVVMGGPMGVNDEDMARHPFLAQELDLLQRSIAADQAILGVCLGSQLLARAAGARVYRNQHGGHWVREVGWGPVTFHDVDRRPELAGLSASEVMLHWHGDTFDLPPGATLLASTAACRNQAFRLNRGGRPGRQIGLQFHCEVDVPTIADWVREDADYVAGALGRDGAARIHDDTARFEPHHRQVSRRLLDNIISTLIAPAP